MPVSVEPVKLTMSMPGWRPMGSPTAGPLPVTTLRTPAGMPASKASSARRSAVSEVSSAGLTMTEQPAASAGPIFHAIISSGKFHGSTQPTTPIGSRTTSAMAPWPTGAVLS